MDQDFEWDEAKRLSNVEKHDIDFKDAKLLFDGRIVLTELSAFEGERRFLTTGILDDRCVTVIWTWRGASIRLISARRAHDSEERKHRAVLEQRDR